MNARQVVTALEHERELLREFYALSEKLLVMLDSEDLEAVNELLDQRCGLMLRLSALEANLSVWIEHIHVDDTVSADMLEALRSIKDEIVYLANQVLDLDEQTHRLLDLIGNPMNSRRLRSIAREQERPRKGYAHAGGPSLTCIN